ncbi:Bug family tripartite tricarboxylate transporter substrate binding protein [Bradyrhizobium tropiciagri]|uniref:Bug family tripartite tricarboxylate transporter substrate binding protein n=1 Tax=Bradyrhizobium tropiciagri TaxID=312253 RepID=UPI0020137439|nr:tripartite tricarboxylate transporter substrate binding protein [Bradyrhizobium tropiciagri]
MASPAAGAEQWPSKIIKAYIPYGAGSATDVVPRTVFEPLSRELGQPIVVENRVGGGGTIGVAAVARSEPDGYSILANSSAHTIAPAMFGNLPYDAAKDLSGVLMIGSSPNVLIVSSLRPWTSVDELIVAAKAKPGSISFGSSGIGTSTHVSAEKFRHRAGFDAVHVPYRGGGEVVTDILGGRIDFYFCPLSTALPLIRDGQVRALMVSTSKRAIDLPNVPTPPDVGLQGAETAIWYAIFVPLKTPRVIVDELHSAGTKVLADAGVQRSLKRLGVEPWPLTPNEIDALVVRELAANRALIQAAGIKLDR